MRLSPLLALALTGVLLGPAAPGAAAAALPQDPPAASDRAAEGVSAALSAPAAEQARAAADGSRSWVVQVAPAELDTAAAYIDAVGAEVTHEYTDALSGFAVQATDAQIRDLTATGVVEHAEPDVVMSVPEPPTSVTMTRPTPRTWHLDRVDQRFLPLDGKVTTPDRPGAGVRVYVVDTGIEAHPDFGGRVAPGYTAFNDGVGTGDCHGHGTHVAGTVASASYGLAPHATLVPVRVLGCDGKGTSTTTAAGLEWIVDNHPDGVPGIVNMSLSGPSNSTSNTAVAAARAAGLLVVAAAGNDTIDACLRSPAMSPAVITVGATDHTDRVTDFSNHGRCLDVWAPGAMVLSTYLNGSAAYMSGTSMAAPLVAGIAAVHAGTGITGPDALTGALLDGASPIMTAVPPASTNRLATIFTDTSDLRPAQPQVTVTEVTHESATLAVAFPPGGAAATRIRTQVRTGGGSWVDRPWTTTIRAYTLTDLQERTAYEARVVAEASGGFTTTSEPVAVTTPAAPLPAPTGLGATVTTHSVTATWDRAGAGITGHTVELSIDAGKTWRSASLPADATTHTFTGVAPAKRAQVRVRAHEGTAAGTWATTTVTTSAVPAPGALTAKATSPTTAQVTFTAPDTGGATLTGYQVQWSTSPSFSQARSATVSTTQHTMTGLTGATRYYVRVRTEVADGWGEFTAPVTVTTDGVAPSAPRSVNAISEATSLRVRWVAPATAPTPVTGYQVSRSTGSGWTTQTVTGGAREVTLTGLAPRSAHQVRVRAVSGTAVSPWVTFQVRTKNVPAPGTGGLPAPASMVMTWAAP